MLAAPDSHALPQNATAAPARLQGRALNVRLSVGDTPLEVVVDTGASVVLALTQEVANSLGLLTGQKPSTMLEAVRSQVVKAPEITFAGTTYEDVDVMILGGARPPGFPTGLMGSGALERSRAILNLGEGSLHLARS